MSLVDLTARVEALILGGDFGPGARLPEQALADQLGVGRGPLREVIRVLEGRRLLERTPHAGVRVARLTDADAMQILQVREALEGMASRLAAENMTLAQVNGLRRCAEALQAIGVQAGMDAVLRVDADLDFHRRIAVGSGNAWVADWLCGDLYALMRLFRMRAGQLRREPHRVHGEHLAIVDRIAARDGDGAERLMREHVRASRERLLADRADRATSGRSPEQSV